MVKVLGKSHSNNSKPQPPTKASQKLASMEELLSQHRKELRDLQAQITQKKKAASKKTRKGVNDECARLEEDLKAKHEIAIAALTKEDGGGVEKSEEDLPDEEAFEGEHLGSTAAEGTSLLREPASLSIGEGQTPPENATQRKKPNRQKARLAKRAADLEAVKEQAASEAASLPDLRKKERARMTEEFEKRGLSEKAVAANGHCMFAAIADQMRQLGLGQDLGADGSNEKEIRNDDYKVVRRAAAEYITSNPDDFAPFLEEPLEDYTRKIKDTAEWGGQLELMALAKTYNLKIHVLQGEGRVEEIESGSGSPAGDVWLAYYRHGFGLGEHYNSLRPALKATAPDKG